MWPPVNLCEVIWDAKSCDEINSRLCGTCTVSWLRGGISCPTVSLQCCVTVSTVLSSAVLLSVLFSPVLYCYQYWSAFLWTPKISSLFSLTSSKSFLFCIFHWLFSFKMPKNGKGNLTRLRLLDCSDCPCFCCSLLNSLFVCLFQWCRIKVAQCTYPLLFETSLFLVNLLLVLKCCYWFLLFLIFILSICCHLILLAGFAYSCLFMLITFSSDVHYSMLNSLAGFAQSH